MREIKFRVAIPKDRIGLIAMGSFCRDGCFYQDDQYLESFIRRANTLCYGSSGHSSYGSAPLMQFTGLKDKNGKEIYEGDMAINIGNESHPKEVVFINGFWSMKSPGIVIVPDWSDTSDVEVIGNIYENPDLLTP